jgi:hypothetical protein
MEVTADENEENTLLLTTLIDLVPNADLTTKVTEVMRGPTPDLAKMIEGYGLLLNILGTAVEYDDWQPSGTLNDRLRAAYYEHVNREDVEGG